MRDADAASHADASDQAPTRRQRGNRANPELRAILDELPGYRNGPYADIRKWVEEQLEQTRTRKRVVHHDSIAVRREGVAQIALVGAPNSGKSSLLQALSNIQIKTGDYAFTTTRPVPALTRIGGVLVQLVEIPGLIEGAAEGRGGARPLLGVLRSADAILFCHDPAVPVDELRTVMHELDVAVIDRPAAIVCDEGRRGRWYGRVTGSVSAARGDRSQRPRRAEPRSTP
jgi:hypothetical protein